MYLYNTLSRKKELFVPQNNNKVSMYVCGITPYDTTHLGHAFTYIFFDVFLRYLRFKSFEVIYTQNVTDINDRDNDILTRAKEQNISWQQLASYWTQKFLSDMAKLNWIKPTNYLKASASIAMIIRIIVVLLNKKFAYEKNGSVFLDISKVKDFGKLSGFSKEEMFVKAKEFEEDLDNLDKRHPLDITLWRASSNPQPAHIPSFESPFGPGRPGWHVECSAMALLSLGANVNHLPGAHAQIDIHGGGQDLIYPHHEAEIAQSESATGIVPFAKYWLHTGVVNYKGKKMSKSLGNLVLISDLLKKYSPNAIRWMLLSNHYRSSWEFKEEELDIAEKKVGAVIAGRSEATTPESGSDAGQVEDAPRGTSMTNNIQDAILSLMDDDMNIPKVLKILEEKSSKTTLKMLGFV